MVALRNKHDQMALDCFFYAEEADFPEILIDGLFIGGTKKKWVEFCRSANFVFLRKALKVLKPVGLPNGEGEYPKRS